MEILIALRIPEKGERKAHACAIGWSHQLRGWPLAGNPVSGEDSLASNKAGAFLA